jgi:DivIVA domain-containing protein
MDGSQLLLKTDFPEARKGYDKAQVDDFLRALSEKVGELKNLVQQATQRAEGAEARLQAVVEERKLVEHARAELETALRASEGTRAELAVALEDARSHLEVDEVAVATGILAMAKRTAEATVDEAVQRAHRLVEDAEVNAAVTQLEAEQRAERTRRDMEDEVEALRRQQLDVLDAEVRKLSAQRDALEADVLDLQDYLDAERAKLREGVESLVGMLAPDGPLALGRQPVATAAAPAGEALPVREPGSEAERRATQIPQLLEGPAPDTSVAGTGDADTEAAGPGAEAEAGGIAGPVAVDGPTDDGTAPPDLSATDPNPTAKATDVDVDGGNRDGTTVIDLDDQASLLGGGDGLAIGDPLGADPTGNEAKGTSPLGAPRGEADTAMREFFEADELASERRGLRRRR